MGATRRAVREAGGVSEGEPRSLPVNLGPLGDAIGFRLRIAQEAAFAAFARRARDAGLRPGRYALLTLIAENPGLSQCALGAAAGRDKSTLTPAMRDLERRGLVRRARAEDDRRAWAVTLTPAGTAALRSLRAAAGAHDAELDALVGPAARAGFVAALSRIVAGLDAGDAR